MSDRPSVDAWIAQAKACGEDCGMYLVHNGVVRKSSRAKANTNADTPDVTAMNVGFDTELIDQAKAETLAMPGIRCVKVWINQGRLAVGDDIMLVLVGGDIRSHVTSALLELVRKLKTLCIREEEIFG